MITFIGNFKSLLLVVYAGLIVFLPSCNRNTVSGGNGNKEIVINNITVEEAAVMIGERHDNPSFVVLDVRTSYEFTAGHLENARNIDYNSNAFSDSLSTLDHNYTFLVYCHSGNRSGKAVELMKARGFTHLYNMLGGFAEWQNKGYPVVR